jgi:hypothetical protein
MQVAASLVSHILAAVTPHCIHIATLGAGQASA